MRRNRINGKCGYCKSVISKSPSFFKGRKYIYCNDACKGNHYRIRMKGKNNPFYGKKHKRELVERIASQNKGKRRSIATEFKKGQKPSTYKGRIISSDKYILIHLPNHPFCQTISGHVREHRLIVEKHIRRYLLKKEIVHHIDGNKMNNQITNLMVFKSISAHNRFHNNPDNVNSDEIIFDGKKI